MSPLLLTPSLVFADALLPAALGVVALTLARRICSPAGLRGWLLLAASLATLGAMPALGWPGLAALAGGSVAVALGAQWIARRSPATGALRLVVRLLALTMAVALVASWILFATPAGSVGGWRLASAFCVLRWSQLLLDAARGELGDARPLELASHLLFFPTFFCGPLVSSPTFVAELRRAAAPPLQLATSAHDALVGLFKVVGLPALVGHLSLLAWQPAELVTQPSLALVAGRAVITFALFYGQWSGLADLARVAGRLAGVELPRELASLRSWSGQAASWAGWQRGVRGWVARSLGWALLAALALLLTAEGRGALSALALPARVHEASLEPAAWRPLHSVKLGAAKSGGLAIETFGDDPYLENRQPWSPRCGAKQVLSLELEARADQSRCADDILQVFFRRAGERYAERASVITPLRCGRRTYHLRVPDALCPAHVRIDPDWGRRPARYTVHGLTLRSAR